METTYTTNLDSPKELEALKQELETLRSERAQSSRVEKFFSLMSENVADLLAIIDPQGQRVWNNSAYFTILGYPPEALEGTYSLAEIHPDDVSRIKDLFDDSVLNGVGHTAEYRMKHRDGHWINLESKVRVVCNDQGDVEYLVLVARDLKNNRRVESELFKTKSITVVSNLARGLKSNFQGVLDSLEHSLTQAESALVQNQFHDVSTYLQNIRNANTRAQEVLQNLLGLGHSEVKEMAEFDLENLINQIIAHSCSSHHQKPSLKFSASSKKIIGNATTLSSAIRNVLENALEASGGGQGVSIIGERITFAPASVNRPIQLGSGKFVKISISDAGPGMTEEVLGRIFEPYFTTKPNKTGLGLTSALSILSQHKGTITVESALGQGTTFYLFLPSMAPDTSRIPLPPRSVIGASNAKKIILLDDEPLVRKFVGRLLSHLGYTITLAANGNEVIDLYRAAFESGAPYDAVIMDLVIPHGVGGAAAIHTLRQIDENVVAIASSGFVDQPVMQDPEAFGFTAAIAKPYNRERLSDVLTAAFKSNRL
jgi:two-component system, cell cycle sensor histidine kinase and response regulator CckA